MSVWSLVYYETQTGRCPVRDYIAGLEAEERTKVTFDLDLLESFGVSLGAPYVRSVRGKLWELRTSGRSQHRILYFVVSGRRLILLHAFAKKTQKTPLADIETARRRMIDYLDRMGQ